MVLPLVKARGGHDRPLPNADAINKCMAMTTTTEAAAYAYKETVQVFTKAKLIDQDAIRKVVDIVGTHASNVESLHNKSSNNLWLGKQLPTDFETIQRQSAVEADEAIKNLLGAKAIDNLTLDFAVSNDSDLLRGYTANGEPLDQDLVSAMDKSFNAWLAERGLVSKGGVIYEGTKDGLPKQDEQGKLLRANSALLREQIMSDKEGFKPYVDKHHQSTQLTIQEQSYPAAQMEPDEAGPSGGAGR
jgi:hypothetical protein